jgi:uncharacterized protein (TIGR02145 family)
LPSDNDFAILEEAALAGDSNVYWLNTTGWRGSTEGRELKVGGSSGFEAKLAGYHDGGSVHDRGTYTHLWVSAELSVSESYRRRLSHTNDAVYRSSLSKDYGFSVRCIKD